MEKLHLTVRADGGSEIGYGHLLRTRTILRALRGLTELDVTYLVRPHTDTSPLEGEGIIRETVRESGWIEELDPEYGPLLLDTYETTVEHLHALRSRGVHVVMLDDGCRLDHYPVDLLVDSAPGASKLPYHGEVATLFALGVDYFPLRGKFTKQGQPDRKNRPAKHLLLTCGGADPEDLTGRCLPMLQRISELERITVVLGPGYRGSVSSADAGGKLVVLRNVGHMEELMHEADIALSTAGGTALELAYMGLPACILPVTPDQEPIAHALVESGAALRINPPGEGEESQLVEQVAMLVGDSSKREQMSRAGMSLVDGKGASRVATLLLDGWRGRRR